MSTATKTDRLADTLANVLTSPNVSDSNGEAANIVDVVDSLASAIGHGLKYLGNGDAATSFGAIEGHGMAVLEAASKVEAGLESIASAIGDLAAAIRERKDDREPFHP